MSQPSRKRRKTGGTKFSMSNFVDDQAAEDDNDEYEEDGDDEDIGGAQFNRHRDEVYAKSFQKARFDFREQVEDIGNKWIERQQAIDEYNRQQQQVQQHQMQAQQHQLQSQQMQAQQRQHVQHHQQPQPQQQMQQSLQQFAKMSSQMTQQMAMLQRSHAQMAQQMSEQMSAAARGLVGASGAPVRQIQGQPPMSQSGSPMRGSPAAAGGGGVGMRGNGQQQQQMAMQMSPQRQRPKQAKRRSGGYDDDMADFVENDLSFNDGGIGEEEQGKRLLEATLPSAKDAKLWLVPCLPGKERIVVMQLLKKYFKYKGTGKKELFIKTAFTTDMNTGYIYVEADKEIHVRRAVEGIFGLSAHKIRIVPPSQMPSTLEIQVSAPEVSKGQWARFKTGLYKGDLCQVFKLLDQGSKVVVRCIPRIDLASINIQRNAKEGQSGYNQTKSNDNNNRRGPWGGRQQGFAKKGGQRPSARFFNRQQMIELGEEVGPKEMDNWLHVRCYKWQGRRFRNGFLLRAEHIRNLDFDISVMEDEYEKWCKTSGNKGDGKSGDGGNSNDNNDSNNNNGNGSNIDSMNNGNNMNNMDDEQEDALLSKAPPMMQKSCDFQRGDTVKVISGALINLIGEVKSVSNDISGETRVFVIPDHKDLGNEVIPFDSKDLQKHFKAGGHVKCLKGVHKDETGLILSIDEEKKEVILFADLTNREIVVGLNDITETTQVSSGRDILGQYSLYELVSLNRDVVGVITEIKTNTLTILDNKGGEQHVRLQDIQRHSRDKYAIALDKDGNEIHIGDVIIPQLGDFRNQRCTVKHIYRQVVFCHSKTCSEHAGIFVTRARLCRIADRTAAAAAQNKNSKNDSTNEANAKKLRVMGKMRRSARDPWMGKTVKVVQGPWKGYSGIVKNCTESQLTVELHARMKTIPVTREQVRVKNVDGTEISDEYPQRNQNSNNQNNNNRFGSNNNNNNYGRNNRYGNSNNNNNNNNSNSNGQERKNDVPFFKNGQRPNKRDGSSSNYRDANRNDRYGKGAETPMIGAFTPAYGSGVGTPGYGAQTPAYGGSFTPAYGNGGGITPAHGSYTPAYDSGMTPSWQASGNDDNAFDPRVGAATPAYGNGNNDYDDHHSNNYNNGHHNDYNDNSNNNNNNNNNNDNDGYHRDSGELRIDEYLVDKAIFLYQGQEWHYDKNGSIGLPSSKVQLIHVMNRSRITCNKSELVRAKPILGRRLQVVKGNFLDKIGTSLGSDETRELVQFDDDMAPIPPEYLVRLQ